MTARYRPRTRDELDPAQRMLHDRIVDGPRRAEASVVPITDADGRLLGPFGPMTIAPVVGDAVQGVGAALRFASTMDARTKEASILLVAARRRCVYEWVLHHDAARAAGVPADAVALLRAGTVPTGIDAETDAALVVVDRLLAASALADEEYTSAPGGGGGGGRAGGGGLGGYPWWPPPAPGVSAPPLGEGVADPWIGGG